MTRTAHWCGQFVLEIARGAGPMVIPQGPLPTRMVATTRDVAVSITETSFDTPFAV